MKFNYWQTLEHDCHYHIYNRTVNQELLFKEEMDHCFFLEKLELYLSPYMEIYTFCLMTNHFHLIVKVNSKFNLQQAISKETSKQAQSYLEGNSTINDFIGDQFRRFFSSYAIKYNNKYQRKGTLFSPKVKRIFIENDDRLRYLIAYVHHNPIHHGL